MRTQLTTTDLQAKMTQETATAFYQLLAQWREACPALLAHYETRLVDSAVAQEREACARIVEAENNEWGDYEPLRNLAAAIRARSEQERAANG